MLQHSPLHRLSNAQQQQAYSFINPESTPVKHSKNSNGLQNSQPKSATSIQIIEQMKKKPYTQFLKGTELTYSLLPKKQASFVLTHQRFLMLRSIQSISYARVFPEQQELPFRHLKDVLTPKATFDLDRVLKVQPGKDEKLIIHFSGQPIITWQFHCPTAICAQEWRRKIDESVALRKEYNNSGFKSMEQFLFERQTRSNRYRLNGNPDDDNSGNLTKSIFDVDNQNNGMTSSQTKSMFDHGGMSPQNHQKNGFGVNGQAFSSNYSINAQDNRSNIFGRLNNSSDTTNRNNSLGSGKHHNNPNYIQDSRYDTPVRGISTDILADSIRKDVQNSGFNINNSNQLGNSKFVPNLNNSNFGYNKNQSNRPNYSQSQSNYSQPSITSLQKYPLGVSADSLSRNQSPDLKKSINKVQTSSSKKRIDDFLTNNSFNKEPYDEPFHGRSMSRVNVKEKQFFLDQLSNYKKSWVAELACDTEEQLQFGELMIDFKNYVEKVSAVMINELYLPKYQKIFPEESVSKDRACYELDDVYIQIYFITPETVESKHQRYREAALQFKNFDYLLSTLEGAYSLIVPLIVLFEHKGFFGMAKSKYGNNLPIKNKDFYQTLNRASFESVARISAQTFLNQSKCRIVEVIPTQTRNGKFYYIDRLTQLLPLQKGELPKNSTKVLRPQFIQGDNFDNMIFRDQFRPIPPAKIIQQKSQNEKRLLSLLQNQQDYFTNSKDLSSLVHENGLNLRCLGNLMQKTKLTWLKKIFRAEILARSLKNLFRCDLQNCIRNQASRIAKNENQKERQNIRVITFLNGIFGLSGEIWARAVNISKKNFEGFTFDNINDINLSYFLQAIQIHFKIVLSEKIHRRKFFTSNQTFQYSDFIRFQFDTTFCNLNWTTFFVQISQCLELKSTQMYDQLTMMISRTTRSGIPYLHILEKYPIYDRICQYLLDFNSPNENKELYNRLQASFLPKKYIFESKFAQIKWYLKANKVQQATNSVKYLGTQIFKWLGEDHPLFVQINRLFAMYFCDQKQNQQNSLKYATTCLEMHKKIHGQNAQIIWKDYLLMGKAYFATKNIQVGLQSLKTAKQLVRVSNLTEYESFAQLNLLLCKGSYINKDYEQAYKMVMQLYSLIKDEKDKQMLFYIIETVSWMKHILESSGSHEIYYQFLQKQFSQHFRSFQAYPDLLITATKMITIPSLKHAIIRRSKNKIRLMSLVQELGKLALSSKNSLTNYVNSKIHDSTFPINLLTSLSEVDRVVDQIVDNELFEKWKSFFLTSNQAAIDKLSRTDMNKGIEFLVNVTALFHCFGKLVLDELHIKEQ